jgi:sec-independent protein translocase protein TatC
VVGRGETTEVAATLPLIEHLEELRHRLIVVLAAIAAAAVVGFFLSESVLQVLGQALPDGTQVIQFRVAEAFGVRVRVGVFTGIAIAMPVILYQIWSFFSPALSARERRLVWPFLIVAVLFFAAGLAAGYLVIPNALSFLLDLALPGVEPMLGLSDYVSFVTLLLLAFGLAFQFPILMLLLNRAGILTYSFLANRRRYAAVIITLFAIVVTPGGDPLSSAVLSVVMYGFFEAALLLMRSTRDARQRADR